MKRIFLVIIIFLETSCFILAYGQDDYVFGVFKSFPVGAFASTDLEDGGGFAEPGWGFMLETKPRGRSWPEGLSLGLHFSYQNNKINSTELKEAYDQIFTESLGTQINTNISSGRFHPFVITAGPYYDLSVGRILSIGIKTGLGMMLLNGDPIAITLFDNQDNMLLQEVFTVSGSPTFTYLAGLNLGFKVSENIRLNLFAEHSSADQSTKTNFRDLPELASKYKINYINTGISFELRFE